MADDAGHAFEPSLRRQPHAGLQPLAAVRPLAEAAAALRIAAHNPAAALRAAPPEAESPGQRAIALMSLAKAAGEEHVTAFLQTLELAVKQASEIVEGKEVYPAGVRDICAKLTEYSANRAQAIFAIMRPENSHRDSGLEANLVEPAHRSLEEADLAAEAEALAEVRAFGRKP